MIKYENILAKAKSYELLSKADQLDPKKRKVILESEIARLQSDLSFSQQELRRINRTIESSTGKPPSLLLNSKSSIERKIQGLQSEIDGLQRELDRVLKEHITSRLKKIITSEQIKNVAKEMIRRTGKTFASVAPVVRYFIMDGHDVKEIHEAIIKAHMHRIIELRPESGMGLLSPKDATLCIPGPRGSTLSAIRVL